VGISRLDFGGSCGSEVGHRCFAACDGLCQHPTDKARYEKERRVLAAENQKSVQNDAAAKAERELLECAQNRDLCNCPCAREGESLD